ncbi:glycogen branching protein [Swaminathania salitolerans LMG 21291]|uniref:1,4-alpha-glucan branching enzyme GlgB n=2 Tax=Swaminathania salitolerans TaxID=182838 RepID=A0A511BL92_9PROT|nr:glycogen branching protein [Swaminathania salitolerans LMG 21291]GEL01116.1 1,4-alpha-glucan branching enzyme GlgB [Swaminathania salitolerans]
MSDRETTPDTMSDTAPDRAPNTAHDMKHEKTATASPAPLTAPLADRAAMDAIVEGRMHDPFSFLGRHRAGRGCVVRVFYPDAVEVRLVVPRKGKPPLERAMQCIDPRGIYEAPISLQSKQYSLRILWADGWQETHDPYSFGTLIGDLDLYLFTQGNHRDIDRIMGAHLGEMDGVSGVRFSVWAPNAHRVAVIGDFNIWDGRRHPMRLRHGAGIWELFVPGIGSGERYKFEIMAMDGTTLPAKADPYARFAELPPATASIVAPPLEHAWQDSDWMDRRGAAQAPDAPLSIYELHVPSWRRENGGTGYTSWNRLGDELIPYVVALGFTHIELMPVTEYPYSGSWGYQPLSMYAPTSRHGTPAEFARFVDRCHQAGIGVIMDWVPAHFPSDPHGLARFDGTHLYEHADPTEGYHQDWHTLIYNFGRTEVRNFLTGSALYWLRTFHIDALRVDAVASMLYRDYSRKEGEWRPNIHGGRENLEAVSFLQELSAILRDYCQDAALIAEESTAWPGVTRPPETGGLGFRFKWNMGWMHDTLRYMQHDPLWRRHHASDITFGMVYAYTERFILPLSHDEVVHGKGSLLSRMPGDDWQRHANLRLYLALMWAYPGKKLLFMGGELAQWEEWDNDRELAWHRLDDPLGRGVHDTVGRLNALYRAHPALHRRDFDHDGFRWVIADDTENTVFAWIRQAPESAPVLIVANMTPVVRHDYRIGVPWGGMWHERLNTDDRAFGGSGVSSGHALHTWQEGAHGMDHSLVLTLPPLAVLYLSPDAG